jgi:hypothetical protein
MALVNAPLFGSRLHHPSSGDTNTGANNGDRRPYPGEGVCESHYGSQSSTVVAAVAQAKFSGTGVLAALAALGESHDRAVQPVAFRARMTKNS